MKKILVLLGVFLMLGMTFVSANPNNETDGTVPTTLEVNTPPQIVDIVLSDESETDQIDLMPGESITVWCNATVDDADGWEDVVYAEATVYAELDEGNDSVHLGTVDTESEECDIVQGSDDRTAEVSCEFSMNHYAQAGEWQCDFLARDSVDQEDQNDTTEVVSELLAFGYEDEEMDFGVLGWGEISELVANELSNFGNVPFDLGVNVEDRDQNSDRAMTCDNGYIPDHFMRAGSEEDYNEMDNVTEITHLLVSASVGNSDNPTPTTPINFGIQVPSEEDHNTLSLDPIEGTCTGNILLDIVRA